MWRCSEHCGPIATVNGRHSAYAKIDSSSDRGSDVSVVLSRLGGGAGFSSYSTEESDVRLVEVVWSCEKTEEAVVDASEVYDAVEALELVLESIVAGELLPDDCCRVHSHLRFFCVEALLTGSSVS